jgi:tetratricopeptide (TPR) repeat protein
LAILQQIEDQFKEQKEDIKTVALVGIGGAGKTTLARQYARSQKQSATVWELNAVTPKSLKDSFEKMALALAESKMDQKILADLQKITPLAEREDQLLQFVKKNLKQRSNWILIYDQIDDLASAPKYFPKDANSWGEGKVILTTRDLNIENNKQINHVINIDELNPEEKFNLFVKIMSNGNEYTFSPVQQGAARKFLEEIPPFPLDVSIAAYYLRATETSYEKYLEHLNDYNQYVDLTQKNLLQGAGEYIKTRYKIISLTLNHLVQLHPDYGSLLFFISLLDAHNIPRGLLDAYKDDAIVDGFIYNLKKHSLITHESSHLPHARPTFSIHHNTQKTNRSYLVRALNLQKNSQLLQAIGCTLESFILGVVEREDISEMNILTKHCETFLSHKNLLPETITTSVRSALGYMYFYLGDYDKANQIIKMSLDSFDRFNIKNDSRAAQLLSYLGNIYRELGNYKKSEDFFKQSLTMYEKYAPEKHMEIVRATTYLGIVYRNLGNYEKAKNLFEKSLLIYQKHLPSNNMKCAGVLALLGNAYKNLGDYLKAKDLLEESLLIYKDNFPESHGFARALSFLAAAYRELGNYGKAKGLLEQALIIYKKNSLENHIDAAWALGILGNIYALLGNYPKAKELLEQSITIYRKFYPEDHVDIAWVSVHLGNVYRETSDYEKAKSFLERSLAIHQNVFGNDNIRTCWVSTQLGNVYKDLGDHTKAEQVLQTSLPVYEKHYGRDHLETARILRNLGQIYLLRNHMEAAERFTNRSLVIFQKNNHPQSYASLENLAELFLAKSINENNPQQAKIFKEQATDLLRQALEVVKAHFPENSPHIARIQSKLLDL